MKSRLSPAAIYQTHLATKKEQNFKAEQPSRSSLSQQLFSAALLSSVSLSSSSRQPFSAALLSSLSQQLFSAAFLSSSSQQPFSAAFPSSFSQQLFSAALLSYHLAWVRGWWSASNFSQLLSLSSLSQQLFSAAFLSSFLSAAFLSSHPQLSSCGGQGLVVG